MKKIKYALKAVVILGIVFAFVVPVTALSSNIERLSIKESLINPLIRGRGWIEQASGFWEASKGIRYMDAVTDDIAWAVGYDGSGGGIYETIFTKTTNGGDLWEANVIFSDTGYGLGNLCGLDDGQTAWAAVFSTGAQDEKCGIYKTINGGNSWTHQTTEPSSFANNVWFFDENDGVALGDQADGYWDIWTSDDGGENWERVPEENFSGHEIGPNEYGWTGCMEAVGDNTIIFGSHAPEGYAYISHDRGHTWFGEYTGCSGSGLNPGVNELAFKDPMHGLAAHDNGIYYELYETDDGGVNWEPITYSGNCYSAGLSYVPGTANTYISTGAVSDASGASYSLDGGHTWTDYTQVSGIQLLSCEFVEGGIGWAGSFNDDEYTGGMYKYIPPPIADFTWTPTHPDAGETINFDASASYDPFGLVITLYEWDWDNDGTYDESYAIPTATHSWSENGSFPVTLRVTADDGEKGTVTKSVGVGNRSPTAPTIDGPPQGKVKTELKYNFMSMDPDDDDIAEYIINWGDGSADETIPGPFISGETVNASHTWTKKGDYIITAKAKDIKGAEGPQGSFSIKIPRTKVVYIPFLNFLENHPNLILILKLVFHQFGL